MNDKLKKYTLMIASLICILLIVYVLEIQNKTQKTNGTNPEINKFITLNMSKCGETKGLGCYKEIAQTLAQNFPINDVLKIFEENEKTPIFFEKCHTTLHFLGQEEYKKLKSTSEALAVGSPVCFAGFYHGVLEEYLSESGLVNNNTELVKVLPKLCGSPSDFKVQKIYNECLHGLGHALMYATDDNLPESLKLCDSLSTESDRNWCYSGSFMENSTSSTNKDHPSKYLKPDDILYPCNILSKPYLNMCYTLQGFYFAELTKYDWKETGNLCLKVPPDYINSCFNSLGQSLVGFSQNPEIIKQNCLLTPEKFQSSCVEGVVGALYERYNQAQDKIETFCDEFGEKLKKICQQRKSDLLVH